MATLTFINPSKLSVWTKLKDRILKIYPKADVRIQEGKDEETGEKQILTRIQVSTGGDRYDPVIEKTIDVTATKGYVTIVVVTTDNSKSHDKSTIGTITLFQERSSTKSYIGVNADSISRYIDRSIDFYSVVTYAGFKDKLAGFIND